jgi:hypothetical protein
VKAFYTRCSSIPVQQVPIIFTEMYIRWQWMSIAVCRNKVSDKCLCCGRYYKFDLFFIWRNSPLWARASSFTRFLYHTQRRTTVGRTLLDVWSARHREFYLTKHYSHNRQTSMPPVEFEPKISAGERPQTYALPRGHWDRHNFETYRYKMSSS